MVAKRVAGPSATTLVAAIVGGVFLLSMLGAVGSFLASARPRASELPSPTVVATPPVVERPVSPTIAIAPKTIAAPTPADPPIAVEADEPGPAPVPGRWNEFWSVPDVATDGDRELLVAPMTVGGEPHLMAIDLATATEVWRTPLARIEGSSEYRHFVIAGGRLVTTDDRAMLRVHDLDDGRVLHETRLTDRVEGLCVSPDAPGRPWLRQIDGRKLAIDVETFTLAEAELPARCSRLMRFTDPRGGNRTLDGGPRVKNFAIDRVLVLDDLGLAMGHHEPGTPTPELVGFDPATKAERWRQPVSTLDPLTVTFEENALGLMTLEHWVGMVRTAPGRHRLVGFAVRTGERLWEIDLDRVSTVLPYLELTEKHVIVGVDHGFSIHRAADGVRIGVI